MKKKATNDFTTDEKNWMDTLAVNYIIAQSDGFQLGYAQAISDFTENIIDYWNSSDDKPQQSILDILVALGEELRKRKETVKHHIERSKEQGYEQYYNWKYKNKDLPFGRIVRLYTKEEPQERMENEND